MSVSRSLSVSLVLLAAALSMGCGAGASALGSCTGTGPGGSACADFEANFVTKDALKAQCPTFWGQGTMGTPSDAPCVATNRVGRCRFTDTTDTRGTTKTVVSYYSPGFTAATAKTNCQSVQAPGVAAEFLP